MKGKCTLKDRIIQKWQKALLLGQNAKRSQKAKQFLKLVADLTWDLFKALVTTIFTFWLGWLAKKYLGL